LDSASDITLTASIILPVFFFFESDKLEDVATYFIMYAETILIANSVKDFVKIALPRYRPYTYYDDTKEEMLKDEDSSRSFFSGHTAIAFSAASFLTSIYSKAYPEDPYRYFIYAIAYGGASVTGLLRIKAGMHFFTDVIAGAGWGTFMGFLIPKLHEVKKGAKDNVDLVVYPDGMGNITCKVKL
jgi:membrane-associated phospholipid phosphatase